jgi:hypothetical protein
MSRTAEISEQIQSEARRRGRLSVPAFGGGFLYLLSTIIISETLNGAPTVGVLQGLTPALEGVASPVRSPRTSEEKFVSHHALPLIAGSVLAAVALSVLVLIVMLLLDALTFRRPQSWRAARPLVLIGGGIFVVMAVVHQVISSVEAHHFSVGHDFSIHAVERATTSGTLNVAVAIVGQVSALAFAAGVIGVMINALRVGLIPRWMGILGMFTGLLLFLPIGGAELQVVPALWMVMMGVLYAGRFPGGDPPAWIAGESRPWPSGAQVRAERQAAKNPGASKRDVPPEPARPVQKGTSRKRRKPPSE